MSRAPHFDPVIHAPGRLQICAILSAADEAEFATIREAIAVSDSVLSKHLKQLEEAGYVAVRKQAHGGRQRTWIGLKPAGRAALNRYLDHMETLIRAARALTT